MQILKTGLLYLLIAAFSVAVWSCTVTAKTISKPEAYSLPDTFTAVIGRTIGAETAAVEGSDGKWHVVYELMLTNAKQVPASIESIEVLDADDLSNVLLTISADELVAGAVELSGRSRLEPDNATLAGDAQLMPSESLVVFIELEFENKTDVVDTIVHRFIGQAATNPGSSEPAPVNYLMVPWEITVRTAARIEPPLKGDGWVVINGCCSTWGAHRTSIQTISGELHNSQRFAIDWMRIGSNGRFFHDDPTDVTNWYNYGTPVYAVADATVVEVLDELNDQPPGTLPDPSTITIQTVDGNHVILDLGGGVYAFYAHLKRGSVRVRVGDKVKTGEQLGQLGNSGNTSAPHLHLHLMTRPSALAADSIPYRIWDAEIVGRVDAEQWENTSNAIDNVWEVYPATGTTSDVPTLPMDLSVIDF